MSSITKFLARDLIIEVDSVIGSGGGSYIPIKGLNTITHSPSSTEADVTDFNSGGHNEHLKAERGETWTCAGFTLTDVSTGARDPGQAIVEAVAKIVGPNSLNGFRITSPGGQTIQFNASAEVTLHGGGNNDAATWQAVLHVSGASLFIPY